MSTILCVFCEKDMSEEKFRDNYTLVGWRDDPDDPNSLNKIAKAAHHHCFSRFIEMNGLKK